MASSKKIITLSDYQKTQFKMFIEVLKPLDVTNYLPKQLLEKEDVLGIWNEARQKTFPKTYDELGNMMIKWLKGFYICKQIRYLQKFLKDQNIVKTLEKRYKEAQK